MNNNDLMLKLICQDITFAMQVIAKIFSGLFLSPDAIAIYVVFALGFAAYWLKAKLNA
jgi:hypothetical protein